MLTADAVKQQQAELRLSLEQQLNAIIESYESQQTQLANTCWQIDETIIGDANLSDSQQGQLHD